VTPLGSEKPIAVELHVISASHCNLEQLVAHNEFREDLYYRLNGMTLTLPPLRERSDRALLIRSVLATESEPEDDAIGIDEDAFAALCSYDWPGNIRQLRNVLRTAAALCEDGVIRLYDLPSAIGRNPAAMIAPETATKRPGTAGCNTLAAAERDALLQELEHNEWNITLTSSRLGMSRNTLYRKMKKHGIEPGRGS
jgi:transcriptional regulator of acetoin/glycerol metabolism